MDMRCPRCACQDDKVVDSRATKEGAGVRRRRECLNCGHRFTTYEEKLRRGIEKACWKRNIRPEQIDTLLSKIVMEIETEYDREISSVEIGTKAMAALRQLDKVAYVRFASVYRDFKDIEEFISEIRTIGAKKR